MTDAQRAEFRDTYNQLRLALVYPGETLAGVTKLYAPVNKDDWTFDYAMTQPDTPDITARRNKRPTSFLVGLGRHRQAVA